MAIALHTIRDMPLYQRYMRPLMWAPVWAYRYCRDKRIEAVLANIAKQDRAWLADARRREERVFADEREPLVSVTTATYNRAKILMEKSLPSALAQTYPRIEIVVVGDHCTDETAALMANVTDPRVRFLNLPKRPVYIRDKVKRYQTHGLEAWALARRMAKGLWVAHLDDDDVFSPDHVEKLVQHAQAGSYEMVYGRSQKEVRPGQWIEQGHAVWNQGKVSGGFISHSTVLRRRYLEFFKGDGCLDVGLAGDAYMWRRMFNADVRVGFLDSIVTRLPLRPGEQHRTILSSNE